MKSKLLLASFWAVFCCSYALPQTYDVGGQGKTPASNSQNQKTPATDAPDQGSNLGWGSSIEVSRQAHAAQDALKRNDYPAAINFAEKAAKSAPQDAELWFLLGYAARLGDRYQVSVNAYNHGLSIHPNSVNGMAGLAQTYAKMGRDAEAAQLLQRVVEANPKDANSLQLAGELLLNSDPNHSLEMLKRADTLQASAHTDLLIAHAYERLGQPEESDRYLNRAKARAPKDPEVLRAVAGQYREQGRYDLAISTLQQLPSKNPDVQAELAYTYQVAGKQQQAANLYTRLAKSAKGNIGLDLSAAQALVGLGQSDGARAFLEGARRIDSNHYRLHAILGSIAESEDRIADASAEYTLALNNLPAHVPEGPLYPIELRLNLYELDLRQEDEAGAKQQLDSAMSSINQATVSAGSRPEMLRLRAAIEAGSGNLDAADKDLQEALALAPSNVNSLLNYGSLQWKIGQKDAAQATFSKVVELDAHNRTALSSLGYLARDAGDAKLAETYFTRAANAHPKDFAPYLALGDLYTAEGKFHSAETNYANAYQRMPSNPLIVAGGANAALESHNPELAKVWLDRSSGKMNNSPQVSRERERYLTLKGEYAESAKLGYAVIEKLPHDREGIVYLAYDLYYLGRYKEASELIAKYDPILSKDRDLALIAGYLHVHDGQSEEALADFTRAIERDPKMTTGYANRGFVLNDLHQAGKAVKDFQTAIQLQPDYGEAHLGLAYAYLQLHRPKPALAQLDAAQKILGESHAWHLARAEGFRQEQDFAHAEPEYRAALRETPNDLVTQLAYADTLYRMHRFQQSITALDAAEKLSPNNPTIYALKAQVHAREGLRQETIHDVQLAEQYGNNQVEIWMATGDALLLLGDQDAAMQRFARAIDLPSKDRVGVRLAIAQVFLRQRHYDDARRQIGLGFAEARADHGTVTADDIEEAANIFLAMHDFDLAETYFDKARQAGANPRTVGIGLANTYLAEGQTGKAEEALAKVGAENDSRDDYDYMMASANLYRQRQDTVHALSTFAQASTVAGPENQDITQFAQQELVSEEGRQLNPNISISPQASFAPSLEDINVYTLDAKILGVTNPALLPPPRHSFQSLAESNYRIHIGNLPIISGVAGESMTTGRLLFPSVNVIQDRNTYDTFFNGGITPVLHLGTNTVTFNGGLQFTVRRDTISPTFMNQDLFRQFLYISTSSFFNWISLNASVIREAGPFTDQNLHSRDAAGSLEFTVGRPWGRTSLLAGYTARDLLFNPIIQEYFNTSSYVGLQQKFTSRLTVAVLAEDLRSWRVQNRNYATAQAFLPGARFEFRANPRWNVQGSFLLSRGAGYHEYDNAQSEFLVSYMRPVQRTSKDGTGGAPVAYPFRVSVGLQQQTFYNFAGSSKSTILPVIHFNLF
ncbi:MAG TPA: tetratricopeptide repeat protein [Terriglobales bacterium]|nr:tetratricopeptide repeat protein [Terriglobales bacterium]